VLVSFPLARKSVDQRKELWVLSHTRLSDQPRIEIPNTTVDMYSSCHRELMNFAFMEYIQYSTCNILLTFDYSIDTKN
jgi:hypothetical protein